MTSQLTLNEMAIVIVGQHHNPSILSPDFLWRNDIVPNNRKLEKNELMVTPVFSRCSFQGGLNIVSQPDQIIFTQNLSQSDDGLTCYNVAQKYLEVVPLVKYVAVGINLTGLVPAHTTHLMPSNMLKVGQSNTFEGVAALAKVHLSYPLDNFTVNLDIESGVLENELRILFRGNFHRQIKSTDDSYKEAITAASNWEEDVVRFNSLVTNSLTDLCQSNE